MMILVATSTKADTFSLSYGLTTNHFNNSSYNYNEDNDLHVFEYKYDASNWGIVLLKFNNSFHNDTSAIGATYDLWSNRYVTIDITAGLIQGYTSENIGSILCPLGDTSNICWYMSPRAHGYLYRSNDVSIKVSIAVFGTSIVTSIGIEVPI
ncbi:MAG: hypothetical protein HRU18_02735 [Pseudoalteromonas sp.]|uniref:hypothetical protein n=1 Tax=Pseudoalteromonas sp. TaxID=53249 RepID=UPI001D56FFB6|nr:hypothetical protein [Pseudoalteromonas sp.]NRA77100.1 hypothetical protein [Pseudoalteromonas sp.]